MKLAFILSMPGCPSWNGKWSGQGSLYAKVISFSSSQKNKAKAQSIIDLGPYSHWWDDGWRAHIDVRLVDGKEARSITKISKGFCGYDWMIDNIRSHGSCYDKKPETVEALNAP